MKSWGYHLCHVQYPYDRRKRYQDVKYCRFFFCFSFGCVFVVDALTRDYQVVNV